MTVLPVQAAEQMHFDDINMRPAFSFRYGETTSTECLARWPAVHTVEADAHGRLEHTTWSDETTGLRVSLHVRRFADFPAVDWVLEFTNSGSANTPILADILPLDLTLSAATGERLRLHHAHGSLGRADDFLPLATDLRAGQPFSLAPQGGRSSSGVLPFMNLQRPGGGLILAIGWTGQWAARFERNESGVRLAAGMERTHLRLHPGETIRTPRIMLLPWSGDDAEIGQNQLRQLLLAHYLPRVDGRLILPPVAHCLQSYYYATGEAGEQYEFRALPRCAPLGVEVYWIDALWYGDRPDWWEAVGTWQINRQRFPHGLKPIADAAHAAGMQFLLWFEPERVRPDTELDREHPDFLLRSDHNPTNHLLDLGNDAARRWITDRVSQILAENAVDIYRQDFNFAPLRYWQATDAAAGPDRIGITEIKHVTGLYAFWDELRARHPGLWIDVCAGGGQRIDLETISRALPLWPSDFPDLIGPPHGLGLHVGDQCINAGLARWIPLFGGGVWDFSPYAVRSQMIGGFTFGCRIDLTRFSMDSPREVAPKEALAHGSFIWDATFPHELVRQAIAEWRSIRPFFTGDFHLLIPLTVSEHDWCAWQFHRPDLAAGIAMFFRRHRSPYGTATVGLRQIEPDAGYEVSLSPGYDPAPSTVLKGRDLQEMTVTISEKPGSLLLRYRRVGP
ncbi:MAG: glycoside hydrolase family 36 protein [Anaerolineae bacterium]